MKRIRIKTWIKFLFFLIIIIGFTYYYGTRIEPKLFKVKEYSIIDKSVPNSFYGNKIVKKINVIKPDIVILSGDLFDKTIEYTNKDYDDLKEVLKKIDYSIGKFAIKGDNDTNKNWEDIINNSNFIDLNDKYELIYNEDIEPILLIGISSNYKNNHIKKTLNSIYKEINTDIKFSILALHEPDFISYIDYSKFNLILAGHSLNGKIKIPFMGGIIHNKYSKTYYDEYYDLGNSKLYISNGIGTNKYKFRLFNTPSISLYRLRNK